jgi:hypothetical protein
MNAVNVESPAWRRPFRSLPAPLLAAVVLAVVAGCGGDAQPTHPAIGSVGPRLSSPATVEIVEPAQAETIDGDSVHVVLRLEGARIVDQASTELRPDQGHVHLYVNGVLVSMKYGLEQDLPVQPGSTVLKAEFVAADHAPFSPRVWSQEVVFTVTQ